MASHLNSNISLRLPPNVRTDLESLIKGRNMTATIIRLIAIGKQLGPDGVWPEDKEVRRAMAAMASRAKAS